MPRTFTLTCDRYLTDQVTPGNRVKIIGILSIVNKMNNRAGAGGGIKQSVQGSYIKVLGIQSENNKDGVNTTGFALPNITAEDEERI